LRSGGEPTQEIYGKAQQYALGRLARGEDPFATPQDLRYPQPQTVDTRPYDRMQATPRSFISGLFSDVLGRTLNMPSMPRTGIPSIDLLYANKNPLFNLMGVGDVQKTAERISYGEPLATGQGMTLRPRDETIGAALTVAPFVGEAAVLGARGARTGARMVGQEIADRVATGQSILPSGFAEPRPSLFAVEPSPSMAVADDSSAMRQQLMVKMQALLAQKKVATSSAEVGAINQQIGELQAQFKSLPAVSRVAREVVVPEITAPVSNLGFYSATEQAAMNLERSKGTGQSFLNDLINAPDVKKDELQYTGLDEFLKDKPNVTKQEVTDYLANNKVDVEEVSYGNIDFTKLPDQQLQKEYVRVRGYEPLDSDGSLMSREEIIYELSGAPATDLTKYGKYQLAGGENYREILLRLPNIKGSGLSAQESQRLNDLVEKRVGSSLAGLTDAEQQEYFALIKKREESASGYKSSHWDEPNILAHMRVNDRVDSDGKKMLLVEEIQSDWHQAGREKGYATTDINTRLKESEKELEQIGLQIRGLNNRMASLSDADLNEFNKLADERQKLYDRQGVLIDEGNALIDRRNAGVPDAPFKDTWYQLALKRIMKYAADNGYDRVGLTTGTQQAKRYDLGNEVNSINVESVAEVPNLQLVDIDVIGGQKIALEVENGVVREGEFAGKRLSDVVGKEMADKITNVAKGETKSLAGEDLRIGGEGMKRYYDEIYPKYLEKYGKKFDASVGETKIITEDNAWNMAEQIKQRGISDAQWRALSEEDKLKLWNDIKQSVGRKQEPVRYIDITPKMKESVGKGQPLFTAIPAGTLGLGGLEYTDPFANPLAEDTTR